MFYRYRNNKCNKVNHNNNNLLSNFLFNNNVQLNKNLYKYKDKDNDILLGNFNKEALY